MANFLLWITRTPTSARNYSRQDRQTCTLLKAAQKISLRIINQVGIDKTSPQYLTKSGEFEDLFSGIGKVEGKLVKLHIDPDVQPKQQLHRRIPFHVRQDVEKELERTGKLRHHQKGDRPNPMDEPHCSGSNEFWRSQNMHRHARSQQGGKAWESPNANHRWPGRRSERCD